MAKLGARGLGAQAWENNDNPFEDSVEHLITHVPKQLQVALATISTHLPAYTELQQSGIEVMESMENCLQSTDPTIKANATAGIYVLCYQTLRKCAKSTKVKIPPATRANVTFEIMDRPKACAALNISEAQATGVVRIALCSIAKNETKDELIGDQKRSRALRKFLSGAVQDDGDK